MNGFVYPRLDSATAMELIFLFRKKGTLRPAFVNKNAKPVEVGTVVTEEILRSVREIVLEAVLPWSKGPVPVSQVAEWDRLVGRALHDSMQIVPSDASHAGPWSFVTLVLLPDVAAKRFPDLHEDRLIGTYRNTFRRCWWRHHIFGDLELPKGTAPLGEDELVNIFERSKMARDHRLARVLAHEILAYEGRDRSKYARALTRSVRAQTGPLLIDALSDDQVRQLVGTHAATVAAGSGASGTVAASPRSVGAPKKVRSKRPRKKVRE